MVSDLDAEAFQRALRKCREAQLRVFGIVGSVPKRRERRQATYAATFLWC
jgi:hypothetical protein